ncbi:MAG: 1-(5-phosphoribosyl)-5-[(5-phosphoribosylamino)methylideneamino]imidazole-4-carboxamide isomerase [Endomicrobiales bacterium]|nr:1-(5-phosphoribosyl)-5-[(5-phosphoribosylamino)methylideneamino]imidazole-4-carboxamide isomerase [Endomicrobiales bacterium]
MLIIPAIDLLDGKCVRLLKGDYNQVSVYSNNPSEIALKWQEAGAKRLHVVDLDGARSGEPKNLSVISSIRKVFKGQIELGGGIRDNSTLENVFSAGIDYAIIGTAVCENIDFVRDAATKHFGKIIIGIDVKDGKVSVKGWKETTTTDAIELGKKLKNIGILEIIFTDISKDGMLIGPNIEQTVSIAVQSRLRVIASGGVSSIEDIKKIKAVEGFGIVGAIVGKALYENKFDLKQAILLAEK